MKNTFLFYDTDPKTSKRQAILFKDPIELIVCENKNQIPSAFERLDKAVSSGCYAAGFLSYELGLIFQEISFEKRSGFPLFSFGIFSSCEKVSLEELEKYSRDAKSPGDFSVSNGFYSLPRDVYYDDLKSIKEHIENGNTYQVNYTFKYKFDFKGPPLGFFNHLRKTQDVPYAGFIDMGRWSILSLSPEVFFRKTGDEMIVRPMKGTSKRGKNIEEDTVNKKVLARSVKNKAENIMIVDLLRNDLGRISQTGSVKPRELFSIEKYQTVFQMTSTVSSNLKEGLSWQKIFENIFPSGSVTGAPKKRTMEIIAETEKEPRDIYTGSIGYITPGGNAQFNVAIRTILIDKKTGKGDMGIGGGIVYDSSPEKEYDECLLKGSFLTNRDFSPEFGLIETILWENGEYFLLDLHLRRLKKSAKYFSFPYDEFNLKKALNEAAKKFDPLKKYRIRMLLKKSGEADITSGVLYDNGAHPVKIAVSARRTGKNNVFFYHKTTNRNMYDKESEISKEKGVFDTIFLNEEGEVTEGAITNILIKKGEEYFTPPLSSGLLGGVYREHLLKTQELPLKEKVLRLEDLNEADEIFLTNAVRKMVPAVLVK